MGRASPAAPELAGSIPLGNSGVQPAFGNCMHASVSAVATASNLTQGSAGAFGLPHQFSSA